MAAASNGSEYFELDVDPTRASFARASNADAVEDDEEELMWEAILRLPSQKRGNFALLKRTASDYNHDGVGELTETIDVRNLTRRKRELVVKKALAANSQDNSKLLATVKERLDR